MRVALERGGGGEELAAERQVVFLQLLLQRDRVRGDDQLALRVHRVDDARHKVREALAHAGARLEEQRLVAEIGGGHRPGHVLLLRAVLQPQ